MKSFTYIYKNKTGKVSRAKIKALNVPHAKTILKERKINPISVKEDEAVISFQTFFGAPKVQEDDIVMFSQLFAGAIRSGLTVKDALRMLAKQIANPVLQDRISDVIVDIDSGSSLSNSFGKHIDIFPSFYPMLLKAGEVSGNLADVLEYVGNYLERIENLKKELKGIFTYPMIITIMALSLVTVILIFVAPTFQRVFLEAKMTLPIPTRIMFFMSGIVKNYYLIILALVGAFYFGFNSFKKTKKGQKALDRFSLNMPLIGKVIKDATLLRFLRTFEILVNNEVPILQALQVLEDGTTNLCLKDIITEMRRDVAKGLPISGALFTYKDIVSPLIAYSVSMGEQSGRLGPTLTRVGNFIDREIIFSMKKLTARLDPLMTFSLGIMVLFIALAIYLPIFDMITSATLTR